MNPPRDPGVWWTQGSVTRAHGDLPLNADTSSPRARYDPPDADLIRRMADDDDLDAFAALFERYRVPVYRAALALTGDPGASEEVLMDTFGRAYTHRRRLRSEPVTEIVAERLVDAAAQPDARAEWTELRQIVREGIAALSVKHQAVVILYYLEGRSLQETADALELPLGTVKSRIHHALRDLRVRLSADRRFGGAWGDVALPEVDGVEARGS